MSSQDNNYPNPLDNFRSYSYHYILTAGSTTEALRNIVGSLGSDSNNELLSIIQTKKLGDEFKVGGQMAYLMLDTRRFSQYSVTSLEMENAYGTGSSVNPSVPTSLLKMQLVDTTGLSFFNFLMDTFRNKMQTSVSSAFFLLTVLFIGHKDDGTTETVSTCNIVLLMTRVGFQFTHKGSEFDIEFVELEGAPQKAATHAQIHSLGTVKTVSTTKSGGANTIGEMIDNLENQLNTQSLQHFQKYVNEANRQGNSKPGKLVQYMITVPGDKNNNWRQQKITGAARSTNVESTFRASEISGQINPSSGTAQQQAVIERTPTYSQITFSEVTPIPDAIKIILESSGDFLKLGSKENRQKGTAKSFRVVTSITSDEYSYIVHFDVYPYYLPKLTDSTALTAGSSTKKIIGETGSSQIKNKIEYDYIFTGRNSQILDLRIEYQPDMARAAIDTDVSVGFFRFAANATAGQKMKNVKEVSVGAPQTSSFSPMIRPGDPIFIPVRTLDQKNNNTSQKGTEAGTKEKAQEAFTAKQEYSETYALLHFLGTLSLGMKIRGNPNLMRKYADRNARRSIAPHQAIVGAADLKNLYDQNQTTAVNNFQSSVKNGFVAAKEKYISEYVLPRIETAEKSSGPDPLLNGPDIALMPLFVKINIRAPDVDWTGAFNDTENMFTNKFFFNGYYLLLTVRSVLSGGDFHQEMMLAPYDVDSSYTTSNDKL